MYLLLSLGWSICTSFLHIGITWEILFLLIDDFYCYLNIPLLNMWLCNYCNDSLHTFLSPTVFGASGRHPWGLALWRAPNNKRQVSRQQARTNSNSQRSLYNIYLVIRFSSSILRVHKSHWWSEPDLWVALAILRRTRLSYLKGTSEMLPSWTSLILEGDLALIYRYFDNVYS